METQQQRCYAAYLSGFDTGKGEGESGLPKDNTPPNQFATDTEKRSYRHGYTEGWQATGNAEQTPTLGIDSFKIELHNR